MSIRFRSVTFVFGVFATMAIYHCRAQAPVSSTSAPLVIADTGVGWIWDHMTSCDQNGSTRSAHAGGPGSSGTYVFSGTGVTVYGVSGSTVSMGNAMHRVGKIRISIDGKVLGDYADTVAGGNGLVILSVHNLADQNHSLTLEAVDMWAGVSSISIERASSQTGSDVADPDDVLPPGTYELSCRTSPGMSLDLLNWGTENGHAIGLYGTNNGTNQQYIVSKIAKGKYVLKSVYDPTVAVCLLNDRNNNTAYLGVWQYQHNPAQVWKITAEPSGYYRLSPALAQGYALTAGQLNPPFGDLSFQPYISGPQQDWQLTPAPPAN